MKVGVKSALAEVELQELSHQVGERVSGSSACAGALTAWFTGDYASHPLLRRLKTLGIEHLPGPAQRCVGGVLGDNARPLGVHVLSVLTV